MEVGQLVAEGMPSDSWLVHYCLHSVHVLGPARNLRGRGRGKGKGRGQAGVGVGWFSFLPMISVWMYPILKYLLQKVKK